MTTLVTRLAPDFTCAAIRADGSVDASFTLSHALAGRYGLLFFYPLDFTFVCPSELIALDRRIDAFRERGVEVIAVSIDSHHVHHAWRDTPVERGGIGPVKYSIAADIKHEVCRAYGVEHDDGVALRAAFVLDRQRIVRAAIVHDLPIGRDLDELLRVFDALSFHERHGEVCPAGWRAGAPGMKADAAGVAAYLAAHGSEL